MAPALHFATPIPDVRQGGAATHKQQATSSKLPAASFKLQAASVKLQAPKLFVYGFERQATSVKLQAASDKLQDIFTFIKFFISVRVTRN